MKCLNISLLFLFWVLNLENFHYEMIRKIHQEISLIKCLERKETNIGNYIVKDYNYILAIYSDSKSKNRLRCGSIWYERKLSMISKTYDIIKFSDLIEKLPEDISLELLYHLDLFT